MPTNPSPPSATPWPATTWSMSSPDALVKVFRSYPETQRPAPIVHPPLVRLFDSTARTSARVSRQSRSASLHMVNLSRE